MVKGAHISPISFKFLYIHQSCVRVQSIQILNLICTCPCLDRCLNSCDWSVGTLLMSLFHATILGVSTVSLAWKEESMNPEGLIYKPVERVVKVDNLSHQARQDCLWDWSKLQSLGVN
jgi:hypothetical protein